MKAAADEIGKPAFAGARFRPTLAITAPGKIRAGAVKVVPKRRVGSRRLQPRVAAPGIAPSLPVGDEIEQDDGVAFHRLSVEQGGAVAPLLHGVGGGGGQHGVAGDYLHLLDGAVGSNGGAERNGALGAGLLGDFRIFGFLTIDEHGLLDISAGPRSGLDRKSTRLNSSHLGISYAVFC